MNSQLNDHDRDTQRRLKLIWDRKKSQLGLTQVKAQAALGYKHQSTVSQYINGKIPLNTETILRFATLLECDPAEIDPTIRRLVPTKVRNVQEAKYLGAMRVSEQDGYELMRTDDMPDSLVAPIQAGLPDGSEYWAITLEHNGYQAIGYHRHSTIYMASNLEPNQGDTVFITHGRLDGFYRYVSVDLELHELIVRDPLRNMKTEHIKLDAVDAFAVVQAVIPQTQKEKRIWALLQ